MTLRASRGIALLLIGVAVTVLSPVRVSALTRPEVSPAVAVTSCTPSETTTLNTAVADATTYLANATDYFDNVRSGSRYTSWFGAFDQARWNEVKATYQAIEDMVISGHIDVECGNNQCSAGVFGFVYPNDTAPYTVYVCDAFWTAPATGTDSKAGTLIHEWTHFDGTGQTSDFAYGKTGAGSLALGNPANAINNADNYEYFAENTPATVDNTPTRVASAVSHDFGTVNVGSSSSSFTVTVTNGGDASLVIGTLVASAGYSLTSNTCSSATVAPNNTCSFGVVFTPSTAGASSGSVSVPNNAGAGALTVSLSGVGQASTTPPTPSANSLNALASPQRLFDTRSGLGGVPAQRVGNAEGTASALMVNVLGRVGLPASGIGSVVLNVTATSTTNPSVGGGYVTVYPCAYAMPNTSNLNFGTGQTIPNSVIAPVDNAGNICFYVYGTAHLFADVSGYFPAGGAVTALAPARLFDTRFGLGGVPVQRVGNAQGSAAALVVNVLGKGGLPSSGLGAAVLNVTVTDTTNPSVGGGYVTVYPCASGRPDASNLNFEAGQTIPNSVIAPVDPSGNVCFYVYGTAHLLADVSGYFATGVGMTALPPSRIFDTRSGSKVGAADGSGGPRIRNVYGLGGLPNSGIRAVVLNVTVTGGENPTVGGGYVTVYPCASGRPDASNLNFEADQTIPNSVIAPVDPSGNVCFYVYGKAHLLADVSGYFPT